MFCYEYAHYLRGSPFHSQSWKHYAEAISSTGKRSVAASVVLILLALTGSGVFYVQRFSTEAVGFYFMVLAVGTSALPEINWSELSSIRGSPIVHLAQAVVTTVLVITLWVHTWTFIRDMAFGRFDTIADLLWEFITTLLGG